MKKYTFLFLSLILSFNPISAISVIEGTWNRKADKISLFEVENGVIKEIAISKLSSNKEFGFAFNQSKAGFYVIGVSPKSGINNYSFYMKPNDRLNVAINDSSYVLKGENTPENIEMKRWHDLIFPIELKSLYFMKVNSNYVDFFPLLDEKLDELQTFKPDYVSDGIFNKAFTEYRRFDLFNSVLTFLSTPRSAHPQEEDLPDFINSITISTVTNTPLVLDYPYGMNLVRMVRMRTAIKRLSLLPEGDKRKTHNLYEAMDTDLPLIIDAKVKGEVVLQDAQFLGSFEGLMTYQQKFEKYLITEDQKLRMRDLLVIKAEIAEGGEAFNFKFKDVNDKDVALSDFKGKLVYIDVWATWCGPCKKEIPGLKVLEKEYAGKNIVFLGVSIDDSKDYNKWKAFLVKENLPGVQIFAGDRRDEIGKPYQITGIPRFILVGKDGKVISSNAPRPTSSEIRILFDASLKK